MFNIINLATILANSLVAFIQERRAGPETDQSKAIAKEIEDLVKRNEANSARIIELETEYYEARRAARDPSWWSQNRQALTVNIVAGVIVGIPFLVLGLVLGLIIK